MVRRSFSGQIDAWVAKVEGRAEAIFRTAVQRTAAEANTPKPQGRLPLDTGFLRASFQGSLDSMPTGPSRRDEGQPDSDSVELTIGRARIGDTIYLGWTASYAPIQETRNAFLESAVQKWPQRVAQATGEAKRRIR